MRAKILSVAVMYVASTLLVIGTPVAAQAHGDCEPDQTTWNTYIMDWATNGERAPFYIKGQTKFWCRNNEQHDKIVVDVRLWRCYVTGWGDWCGSGNWTIWKTVSNTCRDATSCQKTITSPQCTSSFPGYVYLAMGRWAAYNNSGTLVHYNTDPYPQYPAWSPVTVPGAGFRFCP